MSDDDAEVVDFDDARRDQAFRKIRDAILEYQRDPDNPPMTPEMIDRLTAIIMGQQVDE